MKRFVYDAQKNTKAGLTAILSAEWDTHRDACLAAKLRYDLSPQEFDALLAHGTINHRGTIIKVSSYDGEA